MVRFRNHMISENVQVFRGALSGRRSRCGGQAVAAPQFRPARAGIPTPQGSYASLRDRRGLAPDPRGLQRGWL